MPTAPSDELRVGARTVGRRRQPRLLPPVGAILSLGLVLACSSCKKPATQVSAPEIQPSPTVTETKPSPAFEPAPAKKPGNIEGYAVWYNVPDGSLPERRAATGELTAAHNRLPFGTLVRVTRLDSNKSVIVRITDRGVRNRVGVIDLCKEAAEKLDMISDGRARVRLEILPDDKGANAVPDSTSHAAHP